MSEETVRSYSSKRPSLTVNTADPKKTFTFQKGVMKLTNPDDIKLFEEALAIMPPGSRSLIRTVSINVAQKIVQAHKEALGPAAAHGTTTAIRGKQVEDATRSIIDQAEASAQGITLPAQGIPAFDGPTEEQAAAASVDEVSPNPIAEDVPQAPVFALPVAKET